MGLLAVKHAALVAFVGGRVHGPRGGIGLSQTALAVTSRPYGGCGGVSASSFSCRPSKGCPFRAVCRALGSFNRLSGTYEAEALSAFTAAF